MIIETYSPRYLASHALIVGINQYRSASPLGYAVSDAKTIAEILRVRFNFPENNIHLLIDKKASKENILSMYLDFVNQAEVDDRIVFFFAGHGYTYAGRRGDVGYLVPYDGDSNNLSTLLRWDDLTRNAELIPAKHIFFIMDACYGGLAITRSLSPGSMRFLKDMLLRYSRQVLTAGKADERVADSGGPLPQHSIFTGHLIEALQGKASNQDGILTANGIMAYVYEQVARDQNSHQTPHYGFIDGDGDFIFCPPDLSVSENNGTEKDILISVPSSLGEVNMGASTDVVGMTKEYLSDSRYYIKLHDLTAQKLREVLLVTSEDNFAIKDVDFSLDEFRQRLSKYENIIKDLQSISCCIAYWGDEKHYPITRLIVARLTDRLDIQGGLNVWLALRWYPLLLLVYSAGISSVASQKYENLAAMLYSKISNPEYKTHSSNITLALGDAIVEFERMKLFNRLPSHEHHHVARSEYLFKLLQPNLDDLLFLGRDYEDFFDRFEILFALVHADLEYEPNIHIWGPIGRFGWKYFEYGNKMNPFKELQRAALQEKDNWGPIKAGLFRGNYQRFEEVASAYEHVISGLGWF